MQVKCVLWFDYLNKCMHNDYLSIIPRCIYPFGFVAEEIALQFHCKSNYD